MRPEKATMRDVLKTAVLAVTFIAVVLLIGQCCEGGISECYDATCRVTAPSGEMGTGCVFGIKNSSVYVLTNAHVAVGNGSTTMKCEFWRDGHESLPVPGKIVARDSRLDAAVIECHQGAFHGLLPRVLSFAHPGEMPAPGAVSYTHLRAHET